ncbi:MAG: hypothetical protein IJV06_12300 [Bacteroidaceae bacterium]|nr:hypothetical protein [Bacteroidaceae bacterium]MBQ9642320.1 hypothetical protein [Bacteroidaceae bacterium]
MHRTVFILMALLAAMGLSAQDWEPIGTWPFEYKTFRVATVYSGVFNVKKTQVPCNIHLGNQTLWFSRNDTLMEALQGTILRVEFPNGDTFMPVNESQQFGKIIQQDTLCGKVARVLHVRSVDQNAVDRRAVDIMNNSQNLQQTSLNMGAWGAQLSDANAAINEEELPLPLINTFYYQYNGEIFEAKEKNILKHIDQSRRKEYRNYTRQAEIISNNKSSMLKVWNDFFVNYSKPLHVKK